MLQPEIIEGIADELVASAETRVPVPRLTARYPEMTVEDSYVVQSLWRTGNEAAGRKLAGRKIGLTSKAMQAETGITEPDYSIIFDDMVLENGSVLDWNAYANSRVEVELAFRLKSDLRGPDCTLFDVLDATDYVIPALEILDSRIEMEGRTILDTISDNAAIGVMVAGRRPVRPDEVDLRWTGAMLYRIETIEETGLAGGVLNNPASGVAWLANKIATHGDGLKAGELILTGSFTRAGCRRGRPGRVGVHPPRVCVEILRRTFDLLQDATSGGPPKWSTLCRCSTSIRRASFRRSGPGITKGEHMSAIISHEILCLSHRRQDRKS